MLLGKLRDIRRAIKLIPLHTHLERFRRVAVTCETLKSHAPISRSNINATIVIAVKMSSEAISRSSQCSTIGVTKAVVCAILSVGYGYMSSDIWLWTI